MIIRPEKRGKSHKLLWKIGRGLGLAALALSLPACDRIFPGEPVYPMYGPGPGWDVDVLIQGVVISENSRNVIPGIKVSVKDLSHHVYTNSNGMLNIYLPEQDSYELKFEDIDGAENGSFKLLSKEILRNDINPAIPWHIFLEDIEDEE